MGKNWEIIGEEKMIEELKKLRKKILKEAKKGLDEFALVVINEADKIIPFDTGQLENSVINEPVKKNSKTIGYDAPYAAIQHENTSLIHPGPNSSSPARGAKGKPKYLEKPLRENAEKMGEIIASRIKKIR